MITQNKKDNIFFIGIAIFFVIGFISLFLGRIYVFLPNEKTLQKNNISLLGHITSFGSNGGKVSTYGTCSYKVGENYYSLKFYYSRICRNNTMYDKNIIKQLNVTVIYNPDDPNISRVLLSRKDYEKYKTPYPKDKELVKLMERYFECE